MTTRLTRAERLVTHGFIFAVGCWNLVLIDYAHDHGRWWCWLPIAAWSTVLLAHGAWVLLMRWSTRRSSSARPFSHEAAVPARAIEVLNAPVRPQQRQPFTILVSRDGRAGQGCGSGMADGAVD